MKRLELRWILAHGTFLAIYVLAMGFIWLNRPRFSLDAGYAARHDQWETKLWVISIVYLVISNLIGLRFAQRRKALRLANAA